MNVSKMESLNAYCRRTSTNLHINVDAAKKCRERNVKVFSLHHQHLQHHIYTFIYCRPNLVYILVKIIQKIMKFSQEDAIIIKNICIKGSWCMKVDLINVLS